METNKSDDDGFFKPKEDKDKDLSTKLGLKLFDDVKPDMITKVNIEELDNFSVLRTLCKEENKLRKDVMQNYNSNVLGEIINKNLVLRTSLNGWRAEQGERIITSHIQKEETKQTGFLNTRLRGSL